VTLKDTLSRYG